MAANCGGCAQAAQARAQAAASQAAANGGSGTVTWVYVSANGTISEFPTQLAARAARARDGGRGLVREK